MISVISEKDAAFEYLKQIQINDISILRKLDSDYDKPELWRSRNLIAYYILLDLDLNIVLRNYTEFSNYSFFSENSNIRNCPIIATKILEFMKGNGALYEAFCPILLKIALNSKHVNLESFVKNHTPATISWCLSILVRNRKFSKTKTRVVLDNFNHNYLKQQLTTMTAYNLNSYYFVNKYLQDNNINGVLRLNQSMVFSSNPISKELSNKFFSIFVDLIQYNNKKLNNNLIETLLWNRFQFSKQQIETITKLTLDKFSTINSRQRTFIMRWALTRLDYSQLKRVFYQFEITEQLSINILVSFAHELYCGTIIKQAVKKLQILFRSVK